MARPAYRRRRMDTDAQRWAKVTLTRFEPLGMRLETYDGLAGVLVDQCDPAVVVLRSDSGVLFKLGRLQIARDYDVLTALGVPAQRRGPDT